MQASEHLSQKQQSIVPIAAFTASGNPEGLKPALVRGLEAGLSINEINEVLVQLYAYAGFPRSLNALNVFMSLVMSARPRALLMETGQSQAPCPPTPTNTSWAVRTRPNYPARPWPGLCSSLPRQSMSI